MSSMILKKRFLKLRREQRFGKDFGLFTGIQ